MPNPPSKRRYITLEQAAELLGVTSRTVRTRISDGTFTGYRLLGGRSLRLDANEIMAQVEVIPTVVGRPESLRRHYDSQQ